jgi:4'-phosphopantetheinyl transferase
MFSVIRAHPRGMEDNGVEDPVPVELANNAVHVWYVFTDAEPSAHVLARYDEMLSADERARRDRFVFARDRWRFLLTRGLQRTLLARYAAIAPEQCLFDTNQYGKPSLRQCAAGARRLEFSVSHTNGLAAIAIGAGRALGLDVEEITRRPLGLEVRRFFSTVEIHALESLCEAEQRPAFFRYWTLKEAYIKARGMGLSLPLDSFSIRFGAGGQPSVDVSAAANDPRADWQLVEFNPGPRHRMALAIARNGADAAVSFMRFEPCDPAT